jgi:hypothetical protein
MAGATIEERRDPSAPSRSFASWISKPRTVSSPCLSGAPDAASLRCADDRRARGINTHRARLKAHFSCSLSGRSAREEQRRLDAIFEDLLRVCNVWRGACELEGSHHEGEDGSRAATGCGEVGVRKQCGQR